MRQLHQSRNSDTSNCCWCDASTGTWPIWPSKCKGISSFGCSFSIVCRSKNGLWSIYVMKSKLKHFKLKRKVKLTGWCWNSKWQTEKEYQETVCKKNSESHLVDDYGINSITFDQKMEYSKQNGTIITPVSHKNKQVFTWSLEKYLFKMSWFGGGLSNLQGKITSFTAQVLSDVAETVQGNYTR